MQKNKKTLITIIGAVVVILLGIAAVYLAPSQTRDENAVRGTVTSFGQELQQVSLLAPDASTTIATKYARYATPQLLSQWEQNPGQAPGRTASSPWPDHIVIDSIRSQASGFIVTGRIIYMTSNEEEHGGTFGEQPVIMQLIREDGRWLIAAYQTQGEMKPTPSTPASSTSAQ